MTHRLANGDADSKLDNSQWQSGDEPIRGYRLVEPLGTGGFGEVWKCTAPGGLVKALKIITPLPLLGAAHNVAAVLEQAALERVKGIRHPFLLSLERVDVVAGELFIVMELADSNLRQEWEQHRARGRPGISRERLVSYLLEVAEVLDVLNLQHGLQHLDVKPANLLVIDRHVKVADFGLVQSLRDWPLAGRATTSSGLTPTYASPEILTGCLSRYSDQYSLATVYQELLTGQLPYRGRSALELMAKRLTEPPNLEELSPADRPVVARALALTPDERYPSCSAFLQALVGAEVRGTGSQRSPDMLRETARESQPRSAPVPAAPPSASHQMNHCQTPPPRPCGVSLGTNCPPLIHAAALEGGPTPPGATLPSLDDFIVLLLSTQTNCTDLAGSHEPLQYREMPGDVLEHSFAVQALAPSLLESRLDPFRKEYNAQLLERTEQAVTLVVEQPGDFWKLRWSGQKTLKITVAADSAQERTVFTKVTVRIEPLNPRGPRLAPSLLKGRQLLLSSIRSVLQAASERRAQERWPCCFPVRLYPVLSDGEVDRALEGKATDLSTQGIGLLVAQQPTSHRVYLRPDTNNLLAEYAVLVEIVRHKWLRDNSHDLGAVFEQALAR